MKTLTIYHNSSCSKSRATLEILEKSGQPLTVIEYLKQPPATEVLSSLVDQLGVPVEQIVRKKELADLSLTRLPQSREEWIRLLVEHPHLIERPIVSDGKHAVIGRPPENVLALLKE